MDSRTNPSTVHISFFEDPEPCFVCEFLGTEDTACGPGRSDESTCKVIASSAGLFSGKFPFNTSIASSQAELPSWTVEGTKFYIIWDGYSSCTEASGMDVEKWFSFPSSTSSESCSLELVQLDKDEVATNEFQTDHIVEKQTVLNFFKWLYGEYAIVPWPEVYSHPSRDWIIGVLMGNEYLTLPPFIWDGSSLWQHVGLQLGSYGNPGHMALVSGGINRMKGSMFKSDVTASLPKPLNAAQGLRIDEIKKWQRDVSGVYQHLKHPVVWKVFTDTTKGIEDAFQQFDERYSWDDDESAMLGRPEREDDQPLAGLRDLWCWYIDARLFQFDFAGMTWSISAKADLEAATLTPEDEEERTRWLTRFDDGILSGDFLRLPKTENDLDDSYIIPKSEYDAWDNGPAGPFN
ncbi:uncharacterized protein BKA78DRAFT_298015 [Phyllosticta capitalensis]|uniref:uncharacterized protein n=1 Tax=Phyllosticta capitalensis TaxID=121624 RepID=UPI00312E3EE8